MSLNHDGIIIFVNISNHCHPTLTQPLNSSKFVHHFP